MNKIVKTIWMVMAVLVLGSTLFAGGVVTFLKDGRFFNGTLVDMSSNTGVMDYRDGTKVNRNEVWLLNFINGEWNFPDEREELAAGVDTVFLRNGEIMTGKIIDFSSRLLVFEFQGGGQVQESQVARIYFCCEELPAAYEAEEEEEE